MEHRRLADILPTRKAPLNSPFGNELPPFYVGFRLPQKFPPNHQPRPHNQRQPENAFPRFQAAFMLLTNAYALSNAFCSALYAACISRSRLVAWRSIK